MFSEKLREVRIAKGVTQNTVAKELKISRPTYTRYETGERSPDFTTTKMIANYFNVSVDYLLGLNDDNAPKLTIPEELNGAMVAFNRGEFEDLTQDEVDRIAEFAKFVKSQRD